VSTSIVEPPPLSFWQVGQQPSGNARSVVLPSSAALSLAPVEVEAVEANGLVGLLVWVPVATTAAVSL